MAWGNTSGVSLLRSALTMQSARMVWAEGEPLDLGRDVRSGGVTGIHPVREGYLYFSANAPRFWKALCDKVGLSGLAEDPRDDSVRKRADDAAGLSPGCTRRWRIGPLCSGRNTSATSAPCAASRRI